jgi:hypothetical protein
MRIDEALEEPLAILRRAYPAGVPDEDYLPLLAELSEDMSEETVSIVVAELIDGERVVVANDAAAAQSVRVPDRDARHRVRARLAAAGWRSDDEAGD